MSYELQYFAVRGLGEVTRVLFAVGKQEYVDTRYPFDQETYQHPESDVLKAAGAFDINMGRVPLLVYSGPDSNVTIGQSKAIERFVSKKLGLFGSNDNEAALIDMIGEHVRDIKQKYNDAKAGKKGEELDAARTKFIGEELAVWFGKLEKTLSGTNGFAVGDKISYADVVIHSLVKDYFDDLAGAAAAAATAPRVAASAESVSVAAAQWFATRIVTKF
jgi:hypothetical protein